MNFNSSKASGPDCIPVVVLRNCELELSYILPELFNMFLKESSFPDCWKFSLVVHVKNAGERSTTENYCPVSHLSVVIQVFEKLVKDGWSPREIWTFSDFQYGFRSSWSTADLLTVVSDRIARAFNRSGATRAVALHIYRAFNRVWHASRLHKLMSYEISGQIFDFICSFLSNRWLHVGPFLVLHFTYYTLMTFLIMLSVILLSMLMILLFTLNVIRIWSVGTTRIGFWTWLWPTRHCGLG